MKLIRDTLAQWIIKNDPEARVERTDDPAVIANLLREKLLEEAQEVKLAKTKEELVEEVADVREVLSELLHRWDIRESDVAAAMIQKRTERGGFRDGYILYRKEE